MTNSQRRIFLAVVLVAVPIYVTAAAIWLVHYGNQDQSQKADAIIIFGARVNAAGKPSPVLRGRIRHAFELWKKGVAPLIVCTGGVGNNPPAEAIVEKQLLKGWGVPEKAILLDEHSTSTRENAVNAAALLKPGAKVIAVSEPFHLWRCRRECRRSGLVAYPSPEVEAWDPMLPRIKAYYAIREAILVTRDLIRFWT